MKKLEVITCFSWILSLIRFWKQYKLTICVLVVNIAFCIGFGLSIYNVAKGTVLQKINLSMHNDLFFVNMTDGENKYFSFNYPTFKRFKEVAKGMAEVSAYAERECFLGDQFDQNNVNVAFIEYNFFTAMNEIPTHGSLFSDFGDESSDSMVAVISYDFWKRRYAADYELLGKTIQINDVPFKIIGITREKFLGVQPTKPHDVYIPLNMYTQVLQNRNLNVRASNFLSQTSFLFVFGSINENIYRQKLCNLLMNEFIDQNKERMLRNPKILLQDGNYGNPYYERDVRDFLNILTLTWVIVFIVAFISTIGVSIGIIISEIKKISIKLMLGATIKNLIGEWLPRILSLSIISCGIAYIISSGIIKYVIEQYNQYLHLHFIITVGARIWQILLITSGIYFILFLVIGCILLKIARRNNLIFRKTHTFLNRNRIMSLFMAIQITLSVFLLVLGIIIFKYFSAIENYDFGFNSKELVEVRVLIKPAISDQNPKMTAEIMTSFMEHLSDNKEFNNISISKSPLLSKENIWIGMDLPDMPAQGKIPMCLMQRVGPEWFSTIGVRLISGREFTTRDNYGSMAVAIVNKAYAQAMWPNKSAVGMYINNVEIIGVVDNYIIEPTFEYKIPPAIYFPILQAYEISPVIIVRGNTSLSRTVATIKASLEEYDSILSVIDLNIVDNRIKNILWKENICTIIVKFVMILAIILGISGIYSYVKQYIMSIRHELVLRMVLGANYKHIVTVFIYRIVIIFGFGVSIGTMSACFIARAIRANMSNNGMTERLIWLQQFDFNIFVNSGLILMVIIIISIIIMLHEIRQVKLLEIIKN